LSITSILKSSVNEQIACIARVASDKHFRLHTCKLFFPNSFLNLKVLFLSSFNIFNAFYDNATPEIQQTKLGNVVLLQYLGINYFVNFDNMDSSRFETCRFGKLIQ
jgi:hypothetical protein